MMRLKLGVFVATFTFALSVSAATNGAVDFKELFDLVRKNLAGATDSELNRAAVDGLLNSLRGKVVLLSGETDEAKTNTALVSKSGIISDNIAWIRISRVDEGLDKIIENELQKAGATNQLIGIALDLRFAEGDDYAAAAHAANLFQVRELPLLDWGEGVIKSTKKYDAIKIPVVVLVNHETVGAAEALAAVMRETGSALVLGGRTAGAAMIGKEYTLKGGQRVRIASTPVKLGDGTSLNAQGVKPDIEVLTSADEERVFLEDPYASTKTNVSASATLAATNSLASTNRPTRRPRASEADLVRARKEGLPFDADLLAGKALEPEKPLIRDPALARAVDLLKGLAVVRPQRN